MILFESCILRELRLPTVKFGINFHPKLPEVQLKQSKLFDIFQSKRTPLIINATLSKNFKLVMAINID